MPRKARRSQSSTNANVKAAIAGSEEVISELEGKTSEASKFGKRERVTRERGSDPRQKGVSSSSKEFSRLATKPLYPVGGTPPSTYAKRVHGIQLEGSGLGFSTYYSRDPFRTNKIEADIFEYSAVSWGAFQVGTPGTVDTTAHNLGTRVSQIFQTIVDVINYNGRFTPNQLLTSDADWITYINSYCVAFSILWTYFSAFEALDINQSTKSFGKGIGSAGNIGHATELWRRLQMIPIPPGLPEFMSKITGVMYSDVEDYLLFAYINTAASITAVTDWTLATGALSVDVLLTLAETDIAGMESNTAEANIIQEVLSIVYGVPAPLPTPHIINSSVAYDLHFTHASIFHVANQFVIPSGNNGQAAATVPILWRKGMESDPYKEIAFSLLRPQLYDAATLGGHATSSQVGLLIMAANNNSNFSRYYGPNAANNNQILLDNSFAALDFGTPNFFEEEWWSAFLNSTAGIINWFADSRSYDRWDTYYPNVAALADQSLILINKIFFDGMKIRDLR